MSAVTDGLRARWNAFAPREKWMIAAAAAVVAFAIVWMVAIGPALSTLRTAQDQRRALDMQVQRMLNLQAQAQSLQSQPKIGRDEAVRQLELASRQRLGATGRLVISGDRATMTLAGTQADALAQWLAQARATARTLPAEAHLTRNAGGTWEGTLVLNLPRS
jgi:general secretion pathway protein M